MNSGMLRLRGLFERGVEILESAASEYILKPGTTEDGIDPSVIPYSDESSHIAEQYKTLCTKIFVAVEADKRPKSLAVLSSQPNDGKTTTAVNLAATMATSFKQKVIVIDSDLRRPSVHRYLGLPKGPGLVEILQGIQDYRQFTEKPAVRNLYVIPAGGATDSPGTLLNSVGMKVLLSRLTGKFDVVIFDTPPVMRTADAQAVGALCDYRLFVIKAGVTPRHAIDEAFTTLNGTSAMPHSCILSNARRALDYYSYWTNKSYREYYQETQPE
jgi:capsular exopolysaccharide synthesis family protein